MFTFTDLKNPNRNKRGKEDMGSLVCLPYYKYPSIGSL